MRTRLVGAIVALALATPVNAAPPQPATPAALLLFADKLRRAAAGTPPGRFPVQAGVTDTRWTTAGAFHWVSGFVPGQLWEMHRVTGDAEWRRLAEAMDTTLPRLATNTRTHDLGFMLGSPYLPAYATTADAKYADLLRTAARSLDTHWRAKPGVLWSWDAPPGRTRVIADSLMNLELLFWAADHGGGPVLEQHAHAHARRLAKDIQRPDGSTFHVVDYDTRTGKRLRQFTAQGYRDGSTWGRGQAWFLTGMAQTYAATSDPLFLDAARRAAAYYVDRLPRDGVPYWDLTAPAGERTPRDTSAGAVAAFGLTVLAAHDPDPANASTWRAESRRGVAGLLRPPYLAGPEQPAVLSQVILAGKGNPTPDPVLMPYADYYLLRALTA